MSLQDTDTRKPRVCESCKKKKDPWGGGWLYGRWVYSCCIK